MPEMHTFQWFKDRLEIARETGPGDFHANCPVHGGSDSLHVTEKNGKALVRCLAEGCAYRDIVAALEAAPEDGETASVPTITRRRRTARQLAEDGEQVPQVADPLQWYADYCGVSRADIEAFGITATADGWVRHSWGELQVFKDRKPNSGDRRWQPKGATQPRVWPLLPDTLPEEIWLAEGESDTIVLRTVFGKEAYTAGSASQPLSAAEMRGLADRGVSRIVIAYDNDKAGRSGAEETAKAARECHIQVVNAELGDPLTGGPKDWRERHMRGDHSEILTDADALAEEVWCLNDVEPAKDQGLLLERIHPTDHTILFGDGGTGKGVVAAWWVARLTQQGMKVLVLDYEAHASHEWRPRVETFGGNLHNVFIMQPSEAIWDVAGAVGDIIERKDIDLVVVDSITYACLGVEVEKSATAAQYSVAIAQFHRPVLSLAHVTKMDASPAHPFGSIFWSNGARVTISIHKQKDEDYASPRVLQNRKTNQASPFHDVAIDWSWVDTVLPSTLSEKAVANADLKFAIMQVVDYANTSIPKLIEALKESGIEANYKQVNVAKKEAIEFTGQMAAKVGTIGGLSPKRRKRAEPQED